MKITKGKDDVSGLEKLGSDTTEYKYNGPDGDILERFPNQYPTQKYLIQLDFPEFTSLCPKTGQPDFAKISIQYVPDSHCVESKALKMYLFSYRNHGSFMETIVNKIKLDLVHLLDPHQLVVRGFFNPRGGVAIQVNAEYVRKPSNLAVPKNPRSS